jgi:hypothetical protein
MDAKRFGLDVLRLYYPNGWLRYMKDIVPPEDRNFNWFICSKRYADPSTGFYVAEIANGTKFYVKETGRTLVVPISPEDTPKDDRPKVKLLIIDDLPNKDMSDEDILKLATDNKYQGMATLRGCEGDTNGVVCSQALFWFFDNVLDISTKEDKCAIIDYARRNYKCIKNKIPDFPTPQEIDSALKDFSCSLVCKVLYNLITEYTSQMVS